MAWPRSNPPTAHTQKQDVFALIPGAPLCYLLPHWLYGRFLLPEGIDRIVQFRISSCCGFADGLFASMVAERLAAGLDAESLSVWDSAQLLLAIEESRAILADEGAVKR